MLTSIPPTGFLLASSVSAAASRIVDSFFDDTFKGVHHLVFFDYALLVPYFSILIVLSFYGFHRYEMIRGYCKHRGKMAEAAPQRFEQLPAVTIQLPIYNEQYVVERLLE